MIEDVADEKDFPTPTSPNSDSQVRAISKGIFTSKLQLREGTFTIGFLAVDISYLIAHLKWIPTLAREKPIRDQPKTCGARLPPH